MGSLSRDQGPRKSARRNSTTSAPEIAGQLSLVTLTYPTSCAAGPACGRCGSVRRLLDDRCALCGSGAGVTGRRVVETAWSLVLRFARWRAVVFLIGTHVGSALTTVSMTQGQDAADRLVRDGALFVAAVYAGRVVGRLVMDGARRRRARVQLLERV